MSATPSANETHAFRAFAWKEGKKRLAALTVVILLAGVFLVRQEGVEWWNWMEPLMAFGTLAVALVIWLDETHSRFRHSLPKKLTVLFKDKEDNTVMECHQANLSHEGDIRNLGQQLGTQMALAAGVPSNSARSLAFQPQNIRYSPGEVMEQNGDWFMEYRVTFQLNEVPHNAEGTPMEPVRWPETRR